MTRRHRTAGRALARSAVILAALALSACASDTAATRPVFGDRVRPPTPDGVTEIRETLAEQRESTLSQMDPQRPTDSILQYDDGTSWWSPFMDAADFIAPAFRWMLPFLF